MGVALYFVYSDKHFFWTAAPYSRYSSMLILMSSWPQKLEFENLLMSMLIKKPDWEELRGWGMERMNILGRPHTRINVTKVDEATTKAT